MVNAKFIINRGLLDLAHEGEEANLSDCWLEYGAADATEITGAFACYLPVPKTGWPEVDKLPATSSITIPFFCATRNRHLPGNY